MHTSCTRSLPGFAPEGHLKIAQQFTAGLRLQNEVLRPVGTIENPHRDELFNRPYGTRSPSLKSPQQ